MLNTAETMMKPLSGSLRDKLSESKKINMGVKATKGHEEPYAPMIPDVDPDFYEDPKIVNILEFCLQERKNLMLVGPPGIGKSSIVLNVAGRKGMAVEYYGCSGESNTDQLIGTPSATLIDGVKVPVAVFGAAVLAFKHGSVLLMDEADFITPEVSPPDSGNLHQKDYHLFEWETYHRAPPGFLYHRHRQHCRVR